MFHQIDVLTEGRGGHFRPAMWQTFWIIFWTSSQGRARTQSPTTRNYAVEIPTFGEFIRVSTAGVQWLSLAKGELPSWSQYLPCQVSMSFPRSAWDIHCRAHTPQVWWNSPDVLKTLCCQCYLDVGGGFNLTLFIFNIYLVFLSFMHCGILTVLSKVGHLPTNSIGL